MEDFKAAGMTRLNNLDFRQKILTVIASKVHHLALQHTDGLDFV